MITTCEKFSKVGGSKYCHKTNCHTKYLFLNHPDAVEEMDEQDDGERHLREMETYAAYSAAGAQNAYWEDRDAGYIP